MNIDPNSEKDAAFLVAVNKESFSEKMEKVASRLQDAWWGLRQTYWAILSILLMIPPCPWIQRELEYRRIIKLGAKKYSTKDATLSMYRVINARRALRIMTRYDSENDDFLLLPALKPDKN